MNLIRDFLTSNRQRLGLEPYGAPDELSYVVLTPRFRASSHVIFLVLNGASREPVLVIKVPRLPGATGPIEREAANLRAVHALRPGGFTSIPRLITLEEYRGRLLLVETALNGRALDQSAVRRNPESACLAAIEWLAGLRHPERLATSGEWFERLVERPLAQIAERLPLNDEEERMVARTRELAVTLRARHLPAVVQHGDFSHPNVLVLDGGGLGVVDWEQAEPRGLPACDLFYFLTYVAFAIDKAHASGGFAPAFHRAFFGRDAWARPYVLSYAERLRLPLDALTPLFVVCWAQVVAGLIERLAAADDGRERLSAETAAWLRSNRYYALYRYALDHMDELDWHNVPEARERAGTLSGDGVTTW